jgi:hypothetical protein
MPPLTAPPQIWVEAYDAWVAQADKGGPAPVVITLPAVVLTPAEVREVLKLFTPNADV